MSATLVDARATAARRRHRERAATMTGGISILNRLTAAGLRLVTVPLALHALGAERYGMWLAIWSLLSWLTLFDLGTGNGLVNPLTKAQASGDREEVRALLSSAVVLCTATAAAIAATVWLAVRWGLLPALLGLAENSALRAESSAIGLAAGSISAGSFLLSFVAPFCLSAQRGYLSSMASVAGTVMGAIGVIAVAAWRPTTVSFVFAGSLPPLAATLALALYLFSGPFAHACPSPTRFSRRALATIARGGAPLLVMQIANLAAMQSANVLISHRYGTAQVPRYSVSFALFTTAAALCYSMVMPFWPAYSEAFLRGDLEWVAASVRKTLARTVGFMAPACLGAALFGRPVIRLWAGEAAVPPPGLIAAMSVYFVLVVGSTNYGVILLAMNALRLKAALDLLVAVTHIGGFFLLAPALGTVSIPVAGGIGLAVQIAVAWAVWRRRLQSHRQFSPG